MRSIHIYLAHLWELLSLCTIWLLSLFLTLWQSPPDSTSWIKTAGPSGLLEPPPMVIPKLLDRATESSWITPSPGWLREQTNALKFFFKNEKWNTNTNLKHSWNKLNLSSMFQYFDGCVDVSLVLTVSSYLRERIMGPPLLYMFWELAGLSNNGLWDRDEDPDDVLSRYRPPFESRKSISIISHILPVLCCQRREPYQDEAFISTRVFEQTYLLKDDASNLLQKHLFSDMSS